ncbi:hypothetical protein [Ornithinibacillus californiensis]|uniref:hypothetical protein n=1 Tax=Ornithinibacillus californiensis TaxID=161536 RepID=UPI00064DD27B|nr:hypothetical protein [Ornithinibacillus californiensis]
MMKKKRLWFVIAMVLLAGWIYWFYLAKPTAFPTNEALLNEINRVDSGASASEIQDTLVLDAKHVLVPFISDRDDYGLSYWVWEKHKWRVAAISSRGEPRIWKIDRGDPSTYHFVWNIHPEDEMTTMDFYLLRDRNYHISNYGGEDQRDTYYPGIQLGTDVSLSKSYGAMKLPEEWVSVMDAFNQMGISNQSNMFFNSFFPAQYMQFGWIPSYQEGVELSLERTFNGHVYYTDVDITLDYLRILNEGDLEVPFTTRDLSESVD